MLTPLEQKELRFFYVWKLLLTVDTVKGYDTFSRRESILRLREQLVTVEEERLKGKKDFQSTKWIGG